MLSWQRFPAIMICINASVNTTRNNLVKRYIQFESHCLYVCKSRSYTQKFLGWLQAKPVWSYQCNTYKPGLG